jgi:transcriptional regulator with XRE-family HTH domain
MDGWTAEEANQLRELLGLKPEAFARRLSVHKRTVIRWRDGETEPTPAVWEQLDKLLIEAVCKLTSWLHSDQLSRMHRRELLVILAASMDIPLAGVDVLWNGCSQRLAVRH